MSPLYTAVRLALAAWGALTGRGAAGRLAAETSMLHLVGVTLQAYASALVALPATLRERWREPVDAGGSGRAASGGSWPSTV